MDIINQPNNTFNSTYRNDTKTTSKGRNNMALLFEEALKSVKTMSNPTYSDSVHNIGLNHSYENDSVSNLGNASMSKNNPTYGNIWEHLNQYQMFLQQVENGDVPTLPKSSVNAEKEPNYAMYSPATERGRSNSKLAPFKMTTSRQQPLCQKSFNSDLRYQELDEEIPLSDLIPNENNKISNVSKSNDIPIKGCTKSFEEMIEESLNKDQNTKYKEENKTKNNKTQFLKRKSKAYY